MREITRIGDDRTIPVDVRIIASTNRNLAEEIRAKRFREDLYYRLSVLNLSIPPLRQRIGDVPVLVEYFLQHFSKGSGRTLSITPEAIAPLQTLPWPGNVRQLRNIVECAVALCQGNQIDKPLMDMVLKVAVPAVDIVDCPTSDLPVPVKLSRLSPEQEQARIVAVLKECGGNKTLAARQLGIGYTTLWRKLKSFQLL